MDLTDVALNTADAKSAALIVVGGLAVMWGVKRVIAFFKG